MSETQPARYQVLALPGLPIRWGVLDTREWRFLRDPETGGVQSYRYRDAAEDDAGDLNFPRPAACDCIHGGHWHHQQTGACLNVNPVMGPCICAATPEPIRQQQWAAHNARRAQ